MQSTGNITQLLEKWEGGSKDALNNVVEQVHEKLARQARAMMRNERSNHTLQTRALVNETYIRLLEIRNIDLKDRHHFHAVAASIMRRVLVDHARTKQSQKRGNNVIHVSFDEQNANPTYPGTQGMVDVLALNNAMTRLAQRDATQAQVVELRYFGGLTNAEIAEQLSLSAATVKRKWTLAQVWLYRELNEAQ